MKYAISVRSCADGSIIPISGESIWFDLDLLFKNVESSTATYTLSDAKTLDELSSGRLNLVHGADLFVNAGEYFHWETASLSYSTEVETLTLEIKLERAKMNPKSAGDRVISTYLKVGQLKAVEQKVNRLN